MKYNLEIFKANDSVRFDENQLEIFKNNKTLIKNLKLDFSEIEDINAPRRIRSSYGYHGGGIVYELTGMSGLWPQILLIDYVLNDQDIPEAMRCLASKFYHIELINELDLNYVSISNQQGFQVLKILIKDKSDMDFFVKAASLKSRLSFDEMFNIFW